MGDEHHVGVGAHLLRMQAIYFLEILVPPVGSGGKSQLGFSTLRSNNFLPKAVIDVPFSKETWYDIIVFDYFLSET